MSTRRSREGCGVLFELSSAAITATSDRAVTYAMGRLNMNSRTRYSVPRTTKYRCAIDNTFFCT